MALYADVLGYLGGFSVCLNVLISKGNISLQKQLYFYTGYSTEHCLQVVNFFCRKLFH